MFRPLDRRRFQKGHSHVLPRRPLALFIDGSNLYAAAKSLGFDIDYKLLRAEFMRRGKLVRAFYYTALLENDEVLARSARWWTG
jgi:uncharacterized LabA/DUF88 family protein